MYQQTTVPSKIGNMLHLAIILQKESMNQMIFNSITLIKWGTIVNVNIPTSNSNLLCVP